MNILLVNIGRHVSLYSQLKDDCPGVEEIYIAENDMDAPACIMNKRGNNIKISKALDEGFIEDILEICGRKKIVYLFSFIDYGLTKLAASAEAFKKSGTKAVVSPAETIRICEDKYEFYRRLSSSGIPAVPTYLDERIEKEHRYPYFAKPRSGNSSDGVAVVRNRKDLDYYLGKGGYIVQPFMRDKEYGIDLLMKSGRIYDVFMKEKIAMRSGTTDKAVSFWDDGLFAVVEGLTRILDLEGPIDIDVLEKGGRFYVNEINPRFGGGYSSAIVCGKNFFRRYISDQPNLAPADYPLNTKTVRYEKTITAS